MDPSLELGNSMIGSPSPRCGIHSNILFECIIFMELGSPITWCLSPNAGIHIKLNYFERPHHWTWAIQWLDGWAPVLEPIQTIIIWMESISGAMQSNNRMTQPQTWQSMRRRVFSIYVIPGAGQSNDWCLSPRCGIHTTINMFDWIPSSGVGQSIDWTHQPQTWNHSDCVVFVEWILLLRDIAGVMFRVRVLREVFE